MVTSIAIHSHKGGSGKTMVTMNLATYLVQKGYRVVVLDLDLSAPSLQTYYPNSSYKSINDLFLNNIDPSEIIFDATHIFNQDMKGKLFMGLADINADVISKVIQRDKEAMLNDLYLLMGLVRNKLASNPFNADFVLIDTSPGLSPISINTVAVTDYLILLLRLVNADLVGTNHFLRTIHRALKPNTALIVNQVPAKFISEERIKTLINQKIINPIKDENINYAGFIGYDENIINAELAYAFSDIDHPKVSIARPIPYIDQTDGILANSIRVIAKNILGNKLVD